MVRETKLPFDDRSHPYLFDEFPGFHATWEAEDDFGNGIDLPGIDNAQDVVHLSVHPQIQVDKESETLQKCHPKTLCSRKHLGGADWMNDPNDS